MRKRVGDLSGCHLLVLHAKEMSQQCSRHLLTVLFVHSKKWLTPKKTPIGKTVTR